MRGANHFGMEICHSTASIQLLVPEPRALTGSSGSNMEEYKPSRTHLARSLIGKQICSVSSFVYYLFGSAGPEPSLNASLDLGVAPKERIYNDSAIWGLQTSRVPQIQAFCLTVRVPGASTKHEQSRDSRTFFFLSFFSWSAKAPS